MRSMARWRMFIILSGAIFISMVGVGNIVPFLPVYAKDLGASGPVLGLIFSAYSLTRALMAPWVGGLSDQWGRKRFLVVGLIGFGLCALWLFDISTAWGLVANRGLQGIFGAMILPVAMAIMAEAAPIGWEGRVMSVYNLAVLAGFGLGPVIGGVIYDTLGMNSNFGVLAGVSFGAGVMVLFFVKEPPDMEQKEKVSVIQQLGIVKDRYFSTYLISRCTSAVGMSCYIAFLPLLVAEKGMTATHAGLFLGANVGVMVLVQLPAGWLADRVPRLPLVILGASIAGFCKILMPLAEDSTQLLILNLIEGAAASIVLPALTALSVSRGKALGVEMGATMGVYTLAMSVGVCFGPVIGGWLADIFGSQAALYFGGAVAVLGVSALLLPRHRRSAKF